MPIFTQPQSAGTGPPFMQQAFGRANPRLERDLVFVIMSFQGQGMAELYGAIREECAALGLQAKRVDENVGSDFVIKEITALIEKAEFIICDLTHERPNVYYELGYAHGVGNQATNILLTAREKTRLHFDIGPLRVQYYSSIERLRSILTTNLKEMMRITRTASEPVLGPGRAAAAQPSAPAEVAKTPRCF